MNSTDLFHIFSLIKIPNVGPRLSRSLIAYCGSPSAVFKQKRTTLVKIPGIGEKTADDILAFDKFKVAEDEVRFVEDNRIDVLFYLDEEYPFRMKDIDTAPVVLFRKGNTDLNNPKTIAIVGTRNATNLGKDMCEKIVEELALYRPLIISGLAYGIDYYAHKSSVKNGIETVGVLGSGIDQVYPGQNISLAKSMIESGGALLTEYFSGTKPEKENFPTRNRIVAAMSDATLVVETAVKGGAMITAEIAWSFNREVFAIPGRPTDDLSAGCNKLIKLNKAAAVESGADIAFNLGWDITIPEKKKPVLIMSNLTEIERKIVEILKNSPKVHIDSISSQMNNNAGELPLVLLDMEFKGYIQAFPGSMYSLKSN